MRHLLHLLRHAFPEIDAYFEVDNLSIQRRSDASIQLAAMGTDLYFGGLFSQTADGAVQNLWQIAKFGAPLLYRVSMPLVTR